MIGQVIKSNEDKKNYMYLVRHESGDLFIRNLSQQNTNPLNSNIGGRQSKIPEKRPIKQMITFCN